MVFSRLGFQYWATALFALNMWTGVVAQNAPVETPVESALIASVEAAYALRNTDPLKAQDDLARLQAQARLAEQWDVMLAAINYRIDLAFHASDFETISALLDEVLLEQPDWLSAEDRGELERQLAQLWYRQGRFAEALDKLSELEQAFQDTPLLASIYMSQSMIKFAQGVFDESVATGLAALRLYEAQGDIEGQIIAHKNLGLDYFRIDDLDASLYHFNEGTALLEQSEDVFVAVELAANKGITLQALGDLEGAIEAYQWAYDSAVTLNRPLTQAQSLLNIATIYSNEYQQNERALELYAQSLAISQRHDLTYGVMLNHMNMGVAYGRLSRFDEAKVAFDQAYELAEALDRPAVMQHLLGEMAVMYAASGQHRLAYEASLQQQAIAQTLFTQEGDRAIAELRTQYQAERTEQALALAEASNLRQRQWIQLLFSVVALAILLPGATVAFLVYRNRTLQDLYDRNIELVRRLSATAVDRSAANDSEDQLASVYHRLTEVMEQGDLVKNPELTLAEVARAIQSNEKYVSRAIAQFSKMNFNHFINYYRTVEARKALMDVETDLSITEVMLGCGFGHKSTFYSAFRRFVGMTPSQFRTLAQKGAPERMAPMMDPTVDPSIDAFAESR